MIRFEQVVKSYGGNVAVDHLDLEAPTGQITCLVGPSGCGKTTTLRMINRMIEPTSGTITIDGKEAHPNRGCSWGLKPPASSRLLAM